MTFTDPGYDVPTMADACGPRTFAVTGESWTNVALTTGNGYTNTDVYTITALPIISTIVDTYTFTLTATSTLYPAMATKSQTFDVTVTTSCVIGTFTEERTSDAFSGTVPLAPSMTAVDQTLAIYT